MNSAESGHILFPREIFSPGKEGRRALSLPPTATLRSLPGASSARLAVSQRRPDDAWREKIRGTAGVAHG
jgi:hypothetical protein